MITEFKTIHPILLLSNRAAVYCKQGQEFKQAEIKEQFLIIDGTICTPLSNVIYFVQREENETPKVKPAQQQPVSHKVVSPNKRA